MTMAYHGVARRRRHPLATAGLLALLPLFASPAAAQNRGGAPVANWDLANRFDTDKLRLAVRSTNVQGRWIHETDSLWYRWETPQGAQFTLVVPASRTKRPLFDHVRWLRISRRCMASPTTRRTCRSTRSTSRKMAAASASVWTARAISTISARTR
jgi:hypothetical protein